MPVDKTELLLEWTNEAMRLSHKLHEEHIEELLCPGTDDERIALHSSLMELQRTKLQASVVALHHLKQSESCTCSLNRALSNAESCLGIAQDLANQLPYDCPTDLIELHDELEQVHEDMVKLCKLLKPSQDC